MQLEKPDGVPNNLKLIPQQQVSFILHYQIFQMVTPEKKRVCFFSDRWPCICRSYVIVLFACEHIASSAPNLLSIFFSDPTIKFARKKHGFRQFSTHIRPEPY